MMSYWILSFTFFKIGLFGFGGGMAMLPFIFQSVQDVGMMDAKEFSDLVAISQITPGPIVTNAATYVGLDYIGISGAAVATVAVSLPPFILMILTMKFMDRYKESKGLQAVFDGIRPATIGLLASAIVFIAQTSVFTGLHINIIPAAMALVSLGLSLKFKLNPIIITVGMAVLGAVVCA